MTIGDEIHIHNINTYFSDKRSITANTSSNFAQSTYMHPIISAASGHLQIVKSSWFLLSAGIIVEGPISVRMALWSMVYIQA